MRPLIYCNIGKRVWTEYSIKSAQKANPNEDEEWWLSKFHDAGFYITGFSYTVDGIKDNWKNRCETGNAIVMLSSGKPCD